MSERGARENARKTRVAKNNTRARISIEILSIQREEKFSLPMHLFIRARAQKRKKERERKTEERRTNKSKRETKKTHTRTFQRRFDVVHGQQLSLFIIRHVFVCFVLFCSASLFLSQN